MHELLSSGGWGPATKDCRLNVRNAEAEKPGLMLNSWILRFTVQQRNVCFQISPIQGSFFWGWTEGNSPKPSELKRLVRGRQGATDRWRTAHTRVLLCALRLPRFCRVPGFVCCFRDEPLTESNTKCAYWVIFL